MRIRVHYATTYAYRSAARSILQHLRLTPRSHDGQHVVSWRIDADADVRLRQGEDAFGNIVHTLSTDRATTAITLTVAGEVRTADTGGMVSRATERLPPGVFLRETPLTRADEPLRELAAAVAAEAGGGTLTRMHVLLGRLHQSIAFDPAATHVAASAAEAYALRRGVCQDLTHIFLSVARRLGAPARYVSGHLLREDGCVDQEASHAWAEAFVDGLGWVGFDPVNGVCPAERHIRVAVGLDYLDAAPVRGARHGGGEETMEVRLRVMEARQQ